MIFGVSILSLLFISSVIISIQDFKTRLLSVWVIALYAISSLSLVIHFQNTATLISNAIGTCLYFAFILLVLFLYYYFREGRFINIIDTKIGLGDIFIFLAIGITLDLINLIVFFTIAFSVSALSAIFFLKKNKSIPLAGILVWCHLLFIVISGKEVMNLF